MRLRGRAIEAWRGVLTEDELHRLATYNGERSRGIVHSAEYARRMADLQARFDRRREEWRP